MELKVLCGACGAVNNWRFRNLPQKDGSLYYGESIFGCGSCGELHRSPILDLWAGQLLWDWGDGRDGYGATDKEDYRRQANDKLKAYAVTSCEPGPTKQQQQQQQEEPPPAEEAPDKIP